MFCSTASKSAVAHRWLTDPSLLCCDCRAALGGEPEDYSDSVPLDHKWSNVPVAEDDPASTAIPHLEKGKHANLGDKTIGYLDSLVRASSLLALLLLVHIAHLPLRRS